MHYSNDINQDLPVSQNESPIIQNYRPMIKKDKKTVLCLYGSLIFLVIAQIILISYIAFADAELYIGLVGTVLAATSNSVTPSREDDWALWDRKTVLPSFTEGKECKWADFYLPREIRTKESHHDPMPMCVHTQDDVISNEIVTNGYWGRCTSLTSVWNSSVASYPKNERNELFHTFNPSSNLLFIDVGASIGPCILQMLLTTNAKVVAFEPNPDNLFCLTNTLMTLSPTLRNRVYLYPLGLGDQASIQEIYAEHHNMGNSMVSKVKTEENSPIDGPAPIIIERMDQIMNLGTLSKEENPSTSYVPLVKIRGQGHECKILNGMKGVLPRVRTLMVSIDQDLLQEYDCEPKFIYELLTSLRYKLFVFDEMNREQVVNVVLDNPHYDLIARVF